MDPVDFWSLPRVQQLCLKWSTSTLSVVIFRFPSGVSVGPRTSSVRERRVLLLLLPGQPLSCHCHRHRGHLPFSWHQPSTHGASRTGWVRFNPRPDRLLFLEQTWWGWSLITGLNFSTLWLEVLNVSWNEINLCVCVRFCVCWHAHTYHKLIHFNPCIH